MDRLKENPAEKIPHVKEEKISIDKPISNLIDDLQHYESEFDERVLESIGNTSGFYSNDDKV